MADTPERPVGLRRLDTEMDRLRLMRRKALGVLSRLELRLEELHRSRFAWDGVSVRSALEEFLTHVARIEGTYLAASPPERDALLSGALRRLVRLEQLNSEMEESWREASTPDEQEEL